MEEADDTRALVLELVEGPTLADRIKQGPIPLDEALPIARQIAEALEAAHEADVIHRDLKPANIKEGGPRYSAASNWSSVTSETHCSREIGRILPLTRGGEQALWSPWVR